LLLKNGRLVDGRGAQRRIAAVATPVERRSVIHSTVTAATESASRTPRG
jgi:hypothetical protein